MGKLLGRVEQVYKVGLFDVDFFVDSTGAQHDRGASDAVGTRSSDQDQGCDGARHPPRIVVHGNRWVRCQPAIDAF